MTKLLYLGPPTYATKYTTQVVCAQPAPVSSSAGSAKSTTVTQTQADSAQSAFSPDAVSVQAGSKLAYVTEAVDFKTDAILHYKLGSLLGESVTVRFTPVQIQWDFGAGPTAWTSAADSTTVVHKFLETGSQSVLANVRFQAAYRFAGQTNWTTESGYLTKSASVTLIVANKPAPAPIANTQAPAKRVRVRLVERGCAGGAAAGASSAGVAGCP